MSRLPPMWSQSGQPTKAAAASWPKHLASGLAGALFIGWGGTACSIRTGDYWTWNQRGISSDVAEVRVERSSDGYFTHVRVYGENGSTIIKGATRRQGGSCSGRSGHVAVVVMSADGQMVDAVEVSTQARPHRHTLEWFRAELPYEMMPRMVVLVQYRDGGSRSQDRE